MRNFLLLIGLATATPATAEIVSVDAHGFEVRHTINLVVPQAQAFTSFSQIRNWWSKDHTFSGNSANLSLEMRPGGCLCERIDHGGGVEFMRVAFLQPGERVVLRGALGPTLFDANIAVMDVQVGRISGGSKITLTYRASGFDKGNGAELAPLVDQVLGEQMKRLRTYAARAPKSR